MHPQHQQRLLEQQQQQQHSGLGIALSATGTAAGVHLPAFSVAAGAGSMHPQHQQRLLEQQQQQQQHSGLDIALSANGTAAGAHLPAFSVAAGAGSMHPQHQQRLLEQQQQQQQQHSGLGIALSATGSSSQVTSSAIAAAAWLPDSTEFLEQQHMRREQQRLQLKHIGSNQLLATVSQKRTPDCSQAPSVIAAAITAGTATGNSRASLSFGGAAPGVSALSPAGNWAPGGQQPGVGASGAGTERGGPRRVQRTYTCTLCRAIEGKTVACEGHTRDCRYRQMFERGIGEAADSNGQNLATLLQLNQLLVDNSKQNYKKLSLGTVFRRSKNPLYRKILDEHFKPPKLPLTD